MSEEKAVLSCLQEPLHWTRIVLGIDIKVETAHHGAGFVPPLFTFSDTLLHSIEAKSLQ